MVSYQSVHLIHATFQSNCAEGLHFSAFHFSGALSISFLFNFFFYFSVHFLSSVFLFLSFYISGFSGALCTCSIARSSSSDHQEDWGQSPRGKEEEGEMYYSNDESVSEEEKEEREEREEREEEEDEVDKVEVEKEGRREEAERCVVVLSRTNPGVHTGF